MKTLTLLVVLAVGLHCGIVTQCRNTVKILNKVNTVLAHK
jgi:hypothetical protein